jgi:hypothetical protein
MTDTEEGKITNLGEDLFTYYRCLCPPEMHTSSNPLGSANDGPPAMDNGNILSAYSRICTQMDMQTICNFMSANEFAVSNNRGMKVVVELFVLHNVPHFYTSSCNGRAPCPTNSTCTK